MPDDAALLAEADLLNREILPAGAWPDDVAAAEILEDERFGRMLALYVRAAHSAAIDAAHLWNLGSTLNRVGLNHFAAVFLRHAIHAAEEAGDEEWADADAYLALAEVAFDAGEDEIVLVALAHALELGDDEASAAASRLHEELLERLERRGARLDPVLGRLARATRPPRRGRWWLRRRAARTP